MHNPKLKKQINYVEPNGLIYSLNEEEKTASLINCMQDTDIIIPRLVLYESKEYIIKSISPRAINCLKQAKSIEFTSDSEVQTIKIHAIYSSSIESITIPSSVTQIKESCFYNTPNLSKVKVMPRNPCYKSIDDKMIVGKSSKEKENFDVLIFVCPDIENFTIPNFIEIIGSFSFENTNKLRTIEIPEDTQLRIIEENAFNGSSIEHITIPPTVVELKSRCFNGLTQLKTINVNPKNTFYKSIDDKMIVCKSSQNEANFDALFFSNNDGEKVTIPSYIKQICPFVFMKATKVKKIEFPSDSELQVIGKFSFSESSIEIFTCPPHLTQICEYAFYRCKKLREIEIKSDSKISIIGKGAFKETLIDRFTIPPHLTTISEGCFFNCKNLYHVEIPSNSCLQTIEEKSFYCTLLKKFTIPPHLTKICQMAFQFCNILQTIEIPSNSCLQTIEKDAFYGTSITNFLIPASLTDLQKGWMRNINKLMKIDVMPGNPCYKSIDDNMIVGKSSKEKENFDVLTFVSRDIENFTIPNFIEIIGSFSFENADKLRTIEIPEDTQLRIIEENAFNGSSIEHIKIPPTVTHICENSFHGCNNLHKFEFTSDSRLEIIGKDSFSYSSIESITIPTHVKLIDEGAFSFCPNLKRVEFASDSELQIISKSAFSNTLIEEISIPKQIKQISNYAFSSCNKLHKVEILCDSKLEFIDSNAFSGTGIEKISIPSSLTFIGINAFLNCRFLKTIEIPKDSNLKTIKQGAFINTPIESIFIPSSAIELENGWCKSVNKLNKIIVENENPRFKSIDDKIVIAKSSINNDNYDFVTFAVRNIKNVTIPNHIKMIGMYSFDHCEKLTNVEFQQNSILQVIGKYAFHESAIRKISIPSTVTHICENAFSGCVYLLNVEFQNDSKLQVIEANAFRYSVFDSFSLPSQVFLINIGSFRNSNLRKFLIRPDSNLRVIEEEAFKESLIESFYFPPHLIKIGKNCFNSCKNLQIIEFDENSELKNINTNDLYLPRNLIFMIPLSLSKKIGL